MKILQMLKGDPGIAEQRAMMAARYREIRRQEPAKARFLFKRMRAAMDLTERCLNDNLYHQSRQTVLA